MEPKASDCSGKLEPIADWTITGAGLVDGDGLGDSLLDGETLALGLTEALGESDADGLTLGEP